MFSQLLENICVDSKFKIQGLIWWTCYQLADLNFARFLSKSTIFLLVQKKSVRRGSLAHSYVIESNHFQRFNNKEDWNAGNWEIQFRWESQIELNFDVILKIYHQILTYIFFIFNSIWKLWNYYHSDLAWTNIENEMHEKGLEKTHKKQQITLRHCNC